MLSTFSSYVFMYAILERASKLLLPPSLPPWICVRGTVQRMDNEIDGIVFYLPGGNLVLCEGYCIIYSYLSYIHFLSPVLLRILDNHGSIFVWLIISRDRCI